jgi:hypothetical protein
MKKHVAMMATAVLLVARVASAQSTFQALLSGANEVPPNGSPASGFGTVVLNAGQTQITVDESWSGLTAPATASHIHGPGAPGVNAGVIFGFTGVPSATAGAIPEQVFSITPAQVADLFNGLDYMNVHTATFPGGEIRGQLMLVPEPGVLALLGLGAAGIAWRLRRK